MQQIETEQQRWERHVARHVLRGLGVPPRLEGVQVKHIYRDCYRVNVRCRRAVVGAYLSRTQVVIAHSFFARIDTTGRIIGSEPAIKKLYEEEGKW